LLKIVFVILFAGTNIAFHFPAIAQNNVQYKYFSPSDYDEELHEENHDFSHNKVCTSSSWSVETSGNTEKFKALRNVVVPFSRRMLNVRAKVCDFVAIRWDKPEYHSQLKKDLKHFSLIEIKHLSPK